MSIAADATAHSTVFYTPFNDTSSDRFRMAFWRAPRIPPGHRRWALADYSRNLTNTDYIIATFATPPTAFGGRPGPSRQFSVEFTVTTVSTASRSRRFTHFFGGLNASFTCLLMSL